jgi:hypothetical protein
MRDVELFKALATGHKLDGEPKGEIHAESTRTFRVDEDGALPGGSTRPDSRV